MIYTRAFVFDTPIELWPKHYGEDGVPCDKLKWYLANDYRKRITPMLKLLRANHQVNAEGSEVFYQGNEFRFTDTNAWFVANTFLYTIGQCNYRHLRHITLHVPFVPFKGAGVTGSQDENEWDRNMPSLGAGERLCEVLDRNGLDIAPLWKEWYYDVGAAEKKTCSLLQGISTLNLILPSTFDADSTSFVPYYTSHLFETSGLDRMLAGGVQITLVLLGREHHVSLSCPRIETTHRQIIVEAPLNGWSTAEASLSQDGSYSIEATSVEVPDLVWDYGCRVDQSLFMV